MQNEYLAIKITSYVLVLRSKGAGIFPPGNLTGAEFEYPFVFDEMNLDGLPSASFSDQFGVSMVKFKSISSISRRIYYGFVYSGGS